MIKLPVLAVLSALAAGCSEDASPTIERIEHISTRSGVELPMLVVEPAHPRAVVVLFAGGGGHLGLSAQGVSRLNTSFVVRARTRFAEQGLITIVVDSPSDQSDDMDAFRTSAEQAQDIRALVKWAKDEWHVPVWLVGTSRGTISAANSAARGAGADGLVLMSSVTAGNTQRVTLRDVAIEDIAVPTLFIHHDHDACEAAPVAGAHDVAKRFKSEVAWHEIDGGATPSGAECSPESFHGLLGREAQVVHAISQFVAAHPESSEPPVSCPTRSGLVANVAQPRCSS